MSELLSFILDHEDAFKSRTRLASLYSDFRFQQHTNPDGYAANLAAWRSALVHAARAGVIPTSREGVKKKKGGKDGREEGPGTGKGDSLKGLGNDVLAIRTGEELVAALEMSPWGRPMALAAVIQDAVARKEMIPFQSFLNSKQSIYSRSWIPTPWQVIQWSLRQLGVLGAANAAAGNDRLAIGRFIVVENVEAASNAILVTQNELHQTSTSSTYSLQTFTDTFSYIFGASAPCLTANDITVLLTYMSRDKPHLSYSPDTHTIKFAPPNTSIPPPITENDVAIASIKTLLHSLELALPALESRVNELDARAREAVSKKQRSNALAALRSKKIIETTLEKRRANFLLLEETLQKIEQASDNVEIVQAMKSSTQVLRSLNEAVGGVEGVERVTAALREEMEKGTEIGNVIAEGGTEAVLEDEVDEEFEALAKDEREKEEGIERAEREKKEKQEADVTRRRIEELEKFEQERRKQEAREIEKQAITADTQKVPELIAQTGVSAVGKTEMPEFPSAPDDELEMEKSTQSLGRMSLEEGRPSLASSNTEKDENGERAGKEELMPAS